jgi:serine/threonine protein kinase
MAQGHPWENEWKIEDGDFGGKSGQGKAILVSHIAEPHVEGVLKVLRVPKRSKARQRMRREVTSLRTLANQNVKVPHVLADNTHEAENADGELYFVMERIPGLTLAKEINARQRLPLEQAVAVTLDLCDTIAKAHREGVSHRDLKTRKHYRPRF